MSHEIGILGGGLAGISLASFLGNSRISILEAESQPGGLVRSPEKNGIHYDIGPHIIFSKNNEILNLMNKISENEKRTRSNQIFHSGNLIKYPFENFLAMLNNKEEIELCRTAFLNNPYKNMNADNMLAFFLKTFGEGITRLYLQPYNEKIWKFDPCMMDTQMVERIPQPPDQDIIDSCNGKYKEGYVHQLYFTYPKENGIFSIYQGFLNQISDSRLDLKCSRRVIKVSGSSGNWKVRTADGAQHNFQTLINCMPVQEIISALDDVPRDVMQAAQSLFYNSIYIVIVNAKQDYIGNHYAVMLAQRDAIFHRISRINFLGESYQAADGSSTLMMEITFRNGDIYSAMTEEQIIEQTESDLDKLGMIKKNEINFTDIQKAKYAYVIYDLNHRKNISRVLDYLSSKGIYSNGRFAEFEYLNMDSIIDHSQKLAGKLNKELNLE